jgi:hypothetical protein
MFQEKRLTLAAAAAPAVHGWLPTLRIADFEVVGWLGQTRREGPDRHPRPRPHRAGLR